MIKVREFPALAMYPSWAEFVLVLHTERGGRVKTIKRITLCLVIGMVVLMASQVALAFGVRPLVIDLDLKPGDTRDFEIILNPGSNDETVLLSLYQPIQLLDGNLAYQEPTPETFPSVNWVQLDKHEVKVYPGEDAVISGRVKVPFDAGGSHTVVVMAEPKVAADQPGITLIVRYAIRLNIRVDRPGLRPNAKLLDFDMLPGEAGEPVLVARIANPSAWDYLVSGEVTIRDKERRLIERVELNSGASARAGLNQTRMYPGSEVEYIGLVTKRLSPGEYTLRAFFRYGEHGQITQTKTIEVVEGQFSFPGADEIGAFTVDIEGIELEMKPGQRKSQVLQLTSEIQEPSIIAIGGNDIEPDYPYSPLEWVELKGPGQFELPGRGRGRAILTIAVPKDALAASYNGFIVLEAYSPESGEPLSHKVVPLSVLVGDDHLYQVEIKSFQVESTEEGHLLSLDIANTGNVDLIPRADVIILNPAGEFVERASLTMPEAGLKVIPLHRQQLAGSADGLSSGTYQVQVVIYDGTREILSTNMELEIAE